MSYGHFLNKESKFVKKQDMLKMDLFLGLTVQNTIVGERSHKRKANFEPIKYPYKTYLMTEVTQSAPP